MSIPQCHISGFPGTLSQQVTYEINILSHFTIFNNNAAVPPCDYHSYSYEQLMAIIAFTKCNNYSL